MHIIWQFERFLTLNNPWEFTHVIGLDRRDCSPLNIALTRFGHLHGYLILRKTIKINDADVSGYRCIILP